MSSNSEREPLLVRRSSLYGSTNNDESALLKEDTEVKKRSVSFFKLFHYATVFDIFLILIGSLFAIITGGGWPVLSVVFGNMSDSFIIPYNLSSNDSSKLDEFNETIKTTCLYYVYIGCSVLVAGYFQIACWSTAGARQINRLRKDFFYRIMRQEIGWFDKHQSGELTTRLADDLERISEGIGDKLGLLLQYTSACLVGFAIGFWKQWKLSLVMLSLTPLMAITAAFMSKVFTEASTIEQDLYAAAGSVAEEVLSSIRTVTAFNGQKKEILRYDKNLEAGKKEGIRKSIITGFGIGFTFLVVYANYALGFWYGSTLILSGEITPGTIFTVFFCIMIGSFSLGSVTPYMSAIATAKGSAVNVYDIIEKVPSIDSYSDQGITASSVRGDIEFQNITFSYPTRSDVIVLSNFNMSVKSGKTVALVGASGSGKSTVVNLLLRFYDPQLGRIFIDDFDLPSVNLHWLRNMIGVVSQEPILFGCSIRENIAYGWEFAQEHDIIQAAKMANAHDFISQLPEGYETLVGERGVQMSGGQKQRIAIARALVRNPQILLFDEATSALDSESEKIVQQALDKACAGRTTIIIAHRLSTIKNVDAIYVMDKGQVVEFGKHAELMKMKGYYYQMASLQTFQDDEEKTDEIVEGAEEETVPRSPEKLVRSPSWRLSRKVSQQLSLISKEEEKEELEPDVEKPGYCRMLRSNSPEWHLIVIGIICCVLSGLVMPVFAVFYGEIFQTFSLAGDELRRKALFWSMMFFTLGGISFFGQMGMSALLGISGERLTKRLRLQTFQSLLGQDIAWYDDEKHQTGKLATRLGTDAPLVKGATGTRIAIVLSSFFSIIAGLFIAFYFGWRLALVVLGSAPLVAIAGALEMKALGGLEMKDIKVMEEAGKTASEAIENIRTVQSLAREKKFYETYSNHLTVPHKKRLKKAQLYGMSYGFSQAMIFYLYAVSFYYGGYLISISKMQPDDVFKVFFAIAFTAMTIGQSMAFLPDYVKAKVAAGQIFHLIDQVPTIDSFSPLGSKPRIFGEISFKNVHFYYPTRPEVHVLKGISFTIQPGKTFALVGTSGCGKSTIVSLLERFYNPSSGKINIDGQDIRTMNVSWLRSHISLVSQEPILFDCSIRDNIAYGLEDFVSDDSIYNAARTANVHDFIVSLPQGYNTMVGEKGTQLSGGQKQRVAIARALIRNPCILLLDEATSALDSESEKVVQEAINQASQGRTCLIIAHRLSTIQNADIIAVIDSGKIVEQGTHQELVTKQGIYYKLIQAQMISS